MGVLAAKLLLAPAFVIGASLAARRYGARIGGLVGGLPVVAGPILLVFALDHGRAFAAGASAATLLGIVSLIAFIVVYARLASGAHWLASLILGWGAFFAMTAALSGLAVSTPLALACVLVAIGVALLVVPRSRGQRLSEAIPPAWDLPLRGLSALALVLALTALAGQLGAKLSGLLAPFPVIASVLAVFTHALHGQEDLLRIMRGFVLGLVAYALFCFALAESLRSLSIAASFALALAVALLTQSLALALNWRRRDATTASDWGTATSKAGAARAPEPV
ncbi:MAG TPA: hypothetical protein VHU13_08845 [Solirubrobacteraceae bacterium]|jgi:hypothetical protein|nr:hypothetical protein [Solirubrobacteraceae bacterium]